MYREQIKVLDCTVRDGGLMNNWEFSKDTVKAIYRAIALAGVDYIELGYRHDRNMFPPDKSGAWRFCEEDVLREIVDSLDETELEGEPRPKVSVMADVGKTDMDDFIPKNESVIDLVRVATYVKEVDKAIAMAERADELGYETFINIMAISHATEFDLNEALAQLAKSPASTIVIVDSFGALYSEEVDYLCKKYFKHLDGTGKEVGIHAHNNQQLAFANTIEGIIRGCNRLDGTLYGMGRGAGNCPLELLIGFLKNPKYNMRPLIDVIGKELIPWRDKIEWGYLMPYMITGVMDEHPRSAIKFLAGEHNHEYLKFYDEMQDATPID